MRARFATFLASLFFAFAFSPVALAAPEQKSQQPASAPSAPKGIKVERDVQYVPGGDAAQTLDLYLPEPVEPSEATATRS